MRFNDRACALMDIPDLPSGAFEHIGDRKIKPQGGGGNPLDTVSEVLGTDGGGGGILGAVEDVGQAIGGAVEDVGQAVGGGLEEVDKFVNRELPGGWITPAAVAAAVAAPYLAPALAEGAAAASAAEAAAALEAAAIAEGATTAGMVAAANTGLPVGTATLAGLAEAAAPAMAAAAEVGTALPYTEAFDAVNLAKQGLGADQIAQNLSMTGMNSFVAQDMAQLAASGLSPEAIVQTVSYSYTPAELAGTGIESKALGLPSKGLSARQALQGARLASGLLAPRPQMPQMQQYQQPQIARMPQGAIDYSGLLSLLTPRIATRNPNSLLG